ncbi:SYF2 splicing factor-domain-containing protein [Suillus tomentosus]|nr:SYF2 splicing factor-domain-containing protein [Suillus tomentosus]
MNERKAKLEQLRAKMVPFKRSSTKANCAYLIEESARAKITVRDAARLERQRKLAEVLRTQAEAEDRGEDNDNWEKKKARKARRADYEFHEVVLGLAPGSLANSGSSSSALIAFDPSGGQKASTEMPILTLLYADNKPTEDAIDKVVAKMNRDIDKKGKFSRKRLNEDEGDITYINERNRVFNKKIARYYDKYISEIRASFERGTAL